MQVIYINCLFNLINLIRELEYKNFERKSYEKSLIFLSILIVSFIAFFDAKDRIEELDEVAANTPSQVEMKQQIRPPVQQNMNNFQEDKKTDTEKLKQQMQQNNQNLPNNLDKIQERRNTITNPVN
ncbi:MAG: hypothetical protein ACLSA2_09880 [Candidatus Gastranaerophilaceae bacterium]